MAFRFKTGARWLFVHVLLAAALLSPPTAAQARPTASFGYSPAAPHVGQAVTFDASASTGGDGPIVSYRWDFGDGIAQTYTSPLATHAYLLPGSYTVTLTVTGRRGPNDTATASRAVAVSALPSTSPPTPRPPACSDGIDNDNDSLIDAGSDPGCSSRDDGSEVNAPPPTAADCADGIDNDADGKTDFPADPGCASASDPDEPDRATTPAPALLTPFPVVRIVGSSRRSGGEIRLLAVRAPVGATIEVRCHGRGCRLSRQAKTVRALRRVTFPRFQRYFAAGAALGIYVRKPGFIGKYTRFRIRNNKRPARVDRCLFPERSLPAPCPTGPAGG